MVGAGGEGEGALDNKLNINDDKANNNPRITGRRQPKRFANGLVIWSQGRNITNLALLIGVHFSVISRSLKKLHRLHRHRRFRIRIASYKCCSGFLWHTPILMQQSVKRIALSRIQKA